MKNTALIVSIILLSVLIVGLAYISQDKDLCCKYEVCKKITSICDNGDEKDVEGADIASIKGETVILDNIKDGDLVDVDFEVKGSAMGSWFFEGVLPVRVLNQDGEVIRTISAEASEDWMTDEYVPFSFILDIEIEQETVLVLKFEKSNPSGLPENQDSAQISITLKPVEITPVYETMNVKVFFGNSNLNPDAIDCSLVYPVTREIEKTVAVGRASLVELFKGTTQEDEDQGYYTLINDGVEILGLSISNGVARVDLSAKLGEGVGGSCKVTTIRAQISETLKQFSTVDSVIISIEGNSEDILQP